MTEFKEPKCRGEKEGLSDSGLQPDRVAVLRWGSWFGRAPLLHLQSSATDTGELSGDLLREMPKTRLSEWRNVTKHACLSEGCVLEQCYVG